MGGQLRDEGGLAKEVLAEIPDQLTRLDQSTNRRPPFEHVKTYLISFDE